MAPGMGSQSESAAGLGPCARAEEIETVDNANSTNKKNFVM